MYDNNYVSNDSSLTQNNVTVNDPDGTVYFELSTTASKNYENNKPGYNEHIAQSFAVNGVQSYTLVSINNGHLTVDTYRTDTNEKYDSYTIVKSDRAKLDQAIKQGEEIIASGTHSEEDLAELKAAIEAGKSVTSSDIKDIYDAAVVIENAIADLEPIMYGDVNDDGEIAINDAVYIKKYLAGMIELSEKQLERADADKDGDVTINDATLIQKYLAEIITEI